MNNRQLRKLGVPESCLQAAIQAIQATAKAQKIRGKQIKSLFQTDPIEPAVHGRKNHLQSSGWQSGPSRRNDTRSLLLEMPTTHARHLRLPGNDPDPTHGAREPLCCGRSPGLPERPAKHRTKTSQWSTPFHISSSLSPPVRRRQSRRFCGTSHITARIRRYSQTILSSGSG